jgi:hypothetical protein
MAPVFKMGIVAAHSLEARMGKWRIWSIQREYIVEGATRKEADAIRRQKARWHMAVFRIAPLMLALMAGSAHAALGPTNPPPGVTPAAWKQMTGRADWVARSVSNLSPKANRACVYAVVLRLLGGSELEYSLDVTGRQAETPSMRRSVAKGKETDFSESLERNVEEECGGPRGGGLAETLNGVFRFTADNAEWEVANYERLKGDVSRAAEALVKMGAFLPATEAAASATAGMGLPMLNPELFMPRRADPHDGT